MQTQTRNQHPSSQDHCLLLDTRPESNQHLNVRSFTLKRPKAGAAVFNQTGGNSDFVGD